MLIDVNKQVRTAVLLDFHAQGTSARIETIEAMLKATTVT